MCMGMGFRPTIGVEAGDVILLKAGSGRPKSDSDRVLVIASVDGGSALSADGVQIYCLDDFMVKGHTDEYPVTNKAVKKAKRVGVDLLFSDEVLEVPTAFLVEDEDDSRSLEH